MADWTIPLIKILASVTADLTSIQMIVAKAVLMDTLEKIALVNIIYQMNIDLNHF